MEPSQSLNYVNLYATLGRLSSPSDEVMSNISIWYVFCRNVGHWTQNTTSHTWSHKKMSFHNLQKPSFPLHKLEQIIPWQLAHGKISPNFIFTTWHNTLKCSTPELSASILHPWLTSKTHTWTNTLADDIPVSTTGHDIYFLLDQNILQLLTHFTHFAHCFHVNEMVIAPPCRVTVPNFMLVQCGSQVPYVTNAPLPVVQATHNHYSEWTAPVHNGLLGNNIVMMPTHSECSGGCRVTDPCTKNLSNGRKWMVSHMLCVLTSGNVTVTHCISHISSKSVQPFFSCNLQMER
jgi:hypothetical protein